MPTYKDESGTRYGMLAVQAKVGTGAIAYWECLCDCGKKAIVKGVDLRRGNATSCGCVSVSPQIQEGEKYGKLKVVAKHGTHKGRVGWVCDCDCGRTDLIVREDKLLSGETQNCGCDQPIRAKDFGIQWRGKYVSATYLSHPRDSSDPDLLNALWEAFQGD